MNRRSLSFLLLLFFVGTVGEKSMLLALETDGSVSKKSPVLQRNPVAPKRRPNIICIVTDDQGRWAMGRYGNKQIRTPNMDRIGREGITFTNATVTCPVCSPSRATHLTGRYPTELGITDWITTTESKQGLGITGRTWPAVLQKAGYQTALIGKWHLGMQNQFLPTKHGFTHFFGFRGGGTRPMNTFLETAGKSKKYPGALPDVLVTNTIDFIKKNQKKPFAVCLHFRAPHTPYGPVLKIDSAPYEKMDIKAPVVPGTSDKKMKDQTRQYYASVTSVDRNIGRLLKSLETFKLSENTIVIFTSDHGYNLGRHNISTKGNGLWIAGGVRGPKRPNMWDTSVLVPLVVRWPGVIKAGVMSDHLVSNVDFFRTFLGVLSTPIPKDAKPHGIDFSPLFHGKKLAEREAVFGQYDLHNNGLAYLRMIRTKRYKYVHHYRCNSMHELYDLKKDPDERRNICRQNGAVTKELFKKLQTWQKSINDPILKNAYSAANVVVPKP